jgi:aarF domain-containing kinase
VLAAALLPFTLLLTLYPNRHVSYAYSIHQHQQQQQQAAFRPQLLSKQQQQCSPVMRALHRLSEEAAVLFRGVFLVALFTPLCLTAPLVFYWGVARAQWMQLLRWTLEQAGPAFIKWGQWGSSRPDLFPPDVCTTLESLQSNAPAHSSAYSRSAVEAAFGRPLDQLFCWFEDAPLASGSIAQIHRARLAPAAAAECGVAPGTLVAVKIRHPGVGYIMSRDFVLMERAAALSKQMDGLKHLRLDESVRQFGAPLQEQLDLSQEAEHLRKFQHNFRRWRNVSFPTPIYPLVRPDVLVESFEPGSQINGYVTVAGPRKADSTLMGAIAETGLNVYLQMLLKDNFIHADMHPGNILVREVERDSSWVNQAVAALAAQVEWRLGGLLGPLLGVGKVLGVAGSSESLAAPQPQLVLLDTGMIAQLSQTDQSSVVNFFRVSG